MRSLILFTVLALMSAAAHAYDVKGLTMDSGIEEFQKTFPGATCPNAADKRLADTECFAHYGSYAGRQVGPSGFFRDGKLDTLLLTFPRSDTEYMIQVLTDKYGVPTGREMRAYQNAMGAKFERPVITWRKVGFQITLSAGRKIDEMAILFSSDRGQVRGRDKQQEDRGKAQKDM